MSIKVMITGGLGYLGVKLCNYLIDNPSMLCWDGEYRRIDKIVLLDITLDTPNRKLLKEVPEIEIIISDLSSEKNEDLIALGNYDTIFHLASFVSAACQKNPDLGEKNIKMSEFIFNAATKIPNKRSKIIFLSSYLVFENSGKATDVTRPNANAPYGRSKRLIEELGNLYLDKIDFRGLRLPTVIAQRKPTSAATAYSYNIPNKLLNGEDYVIPVRPNYQMPFIWIEDTIRALIAIHNLNEELLSLNNAAYRVINVTGISVSTKNWVQEIKNIAKKNKVNIGNVTWEEDAFTLELLNSAINEIEGSFAAMHNISPRTSISEMVQNILDEKRVKKI